MRAAWHYQHIVVNLLILGYVPLDRPLQGGTVAVVALSDPDFLVDPYPAITEHRHRGIVPNPDQGGWWVLDSDTIWQLIRDPKSASDPELADPDAPITKVFKQGRLSMFYMDPPDHSRVRGSVKADFAPRPVADLTASITATATEILERLPAAGRIDIAAQFCDALPMTVMCDFLGVEPCRRDEFRQWTLTRIGRMFNPKLSATPEFAEATERLRGYFAERIAAAQRGPVPGLVGQLVTGGELSHDEMVDLLVVMLGAGIITTADLLGNTLHALVTHPDELAVLRADPSLIPDAIEETLRYDSPALSAGRILTEDREMFGELIPAGTWLRLMTAAVGRDPARNPEPDRYRIRRERREHVAFGGGLHHCLGMHLGKLEAVIGLRLVLERYGSIRLADGPGAAQRRNMPGFRGFDHLVVEVA
jgi:cytochrome P450